VAGVAAIALALGGAAVASAAPGDPDSPLILPGEATEPITGTVTVHKHEQGSSAGSPANGLPQDVTSDPIPGVTFTARQIVSVTDVSGTHNIDLTTNQGWLNAALLVRDSDGDWTFDGQPATPNFAAETHTEDTGPADGTYEDAVFADLPVGLYLFQETAAPANVTKSAPWVMTVPLTDPIGDSAGDIGPNERWNYNIHVYPKNSITGVTKSVADAIAVKVGDPVAWTVTGDIPLVANPEFNSDEDVSAGNLKFFAPTAYVVKDDLDVRLTPASSNPVVVTLMDGGSVSLDAADYTIAWADPNPVGAGSELTLTFTTAGLNKLGLAVSSAANPGNVKVQVVLNTVVTSLNNPDDVDDPTNGTIGDGIIRNQAELFPNQSAVDSDTPVLSNEPESRWGDIIIRKVDATDSENLLAGAEFQVFASQEAAEAGIEPITINGDSTFVTEAGGQVTISGLRYSNWADGVSLGEEEGDEWQYYWIVETKSPEGFELLAEPIRVAVTAAQQEVDVTEIENVPTNAGFELPLTGGMGTAILTIVGIAILAIVLLVARRRRASEVAAE